MEAFDFSLTGCRLEPFLLALGRRTICSQKLLEIVLMRMGFPPQYTMKETTSSKKENREFETICFRIGREFTVGKITKKIIPPSGHF